MPHLVETVYDRCRLSTKMGSYKKDAEEELPHTGQISAPEQHFLNSADKGGFCLTFALHTTLRREGGSRYIICVLTSLKRLAVVTPMYSKKCRLEKKGENAVRNIGHWEREEGQWGQSAENLCLPARLWANTARICSTKCTSPKK